MKTFIVIVCVLFVVSCTKTPYEHVLEYAEAVKVTPIEIPYEKNFDIGWCEPADFNKCFYLL